MSQSLRDARRYEEERERLIAPEDRPAFHLSARVGWMNDPNGFSFHGGQYHMFYQYHPYDSHWGPMHWGHAASDDLLRWRYLPAAMAPDRCAFMPVKAITAARPLPRAERAYSAVSPGVRWGERTCTS